jgi:hypothetical protein
MNHSENTSDARSASILFRLQLPEGGGRTCFEGEKLRRLGERFTWLGEEILKNLEKLQ